MINDRRLKQAALQYLVSKQWFPQMELVVQAQSSATTRSYDITDIDVHGAAPDEFSGYRTILIDCKSGRRESVITRALWLKGLMEYFHASWGICIFNEQKKIELDHRETAATLGVSLMTMSEFEVFARATDGDIQKSNSNLADIDKWELYLQIPNRFINLQPVIEFSLGKFWGLPDAGSQCRRSIAILRTLKSELDPAKREHMVIFGDVLALFLYASAQVSHRLFQAYLQPESRDTLDEVLLPYVYGGRESYTLMNQLNASIPRRNDQGREPQDLVLPEWNLFVHLIRSMLDAPMQALYTPLVAREVAWSYLADKEDLNFAKQIAMEKRQIGKYCLQATKYLVAAATLPPEFEERFREIFISIQS